MIYNTNEERLRLPQYGRGVQQMVDAALAETRRSVQQVMAERIVKVMAAVNPDVANSPDANTILWNHLAYMSDYKFDITYPCEIEKHVCGEHPGKLSYPGHRIRYRHYGYLLEQALRNLGQLPPQFLGRDEMIQAVALRMKRDLADWKGDGIENEKVGRDLASYTDGKVGVEETIALLENAERRNRNSSRNNRRGRR